MNQDTTQPSPSEKVAQFLVAQEMAMGIARLVAWAQGKALSHKRTGWPSNMFPNRHLRRELFSAIQRGGRRETPGGTVTSSPKDRQIRNWEKAARRKKRGK